MVGYDEILDDNDGNLNVPRYIQRPSAELPSGILRIFKAASRGDLDSLAALWRNGSSGNSAVCP